MAKRKPVVSPRAVPPSADDSVEVRPRDESFTPLDPPDPDEDDDDDDEESEDDPIGDAGFGHDEEAAFRARPDSFDEHAWPGGPRVGAGAAASAGLGALPTFDPEHPPLPRVPLAGVVDEQLRSIGGRGGFGNGHAQGYDEREPVRPPQPGAPQQSFGGPLPMWPDQADFDMTTQIVIKRREVDGSLANLGPFPKDATIDMLLSKYPNPGVYFVFPVDAQGREFDRHNPTRIDIPADHEFFRRKKQLEEINAGSGAQALRAMGMSGQVVAPEFLMLVNKLFDQQRAETERIAAKAEADRVAVEMERLKLQDRDQALAVREIEHVTNASKDLLQAANSQFSGVILMLQTMNQTTLQQAEAAAERERQRLEASNKAALEQSQQMSKMMFEQFTAVTKLHTDVAERERQRDKDALEAEKLRVIDQGKMQTTFMNAEERRRQTAAEVERKATPKEGVPGMMEMVDNYKKMKEAFGDEGGGEGAGGWMGAFEKAAEMFQEAQRMKHEMRLAKMQLRAGIAPGGPLPPGFEDDDDDLDEDSDDMNPVAMGQPALRGPVAGGVNVPGPYAGVMQPQPQPVAQPDAFAGLGVPMGKLRQAVPPPPSAAPPGAMMPAQQAPSALAAPGAAQAAPVFDPNFTDAKQAVQITVDRLAQEPNRQLWGEIVAGAIMAVPSMLDYFRVATVFGAMMDNGADEALANEVCTAASAIALQNGVPIR